MLFSLLKLPYVNEANEVFICNTNLLNSSRLMISPYSIKLFASLGESLLPSKGLYFGSAANLWYQSLASGQKCGTG